MFEALPARSQEDLTEAAESDDPFARWACAVELSQHTDSQWACDLLLKLSTDAEENTRTSAVSGLRQFPVEFVSISRRDSAVISAETRSSISEWKMRPLPIFDKAAYGVFELAVLDILATETYATGGRLNRLLSGSVDPNSPSKFAKGRLKVLLEGMINRGVLTRHDTRFKDESIDAWILSRRGNPPIEVKQLGTRKLSEIPVIELKALLANAPSLLGRRPDQNRQFEVICSHYGISPSQFHLVGALLDKEWSGIFA